MVYTWAMWAALLTFGLGKALAAIIGLHVKIIPLVLPGFAIRKDTLAAHSSREPLKSPEKTLIEGYAS